MKRYAILAVATLAVLTGILGIRCATPTTVETVTLHARDAVKTELCPARVIDRTQVQMFVRESLATTVKVGQAAAVSGVGFEKERYNGVVSAIASAASTQNGATGLLAVVTLDKGDDSIKKGLSAAVRVTVKEYRRAIVLNNEWLTFEEDDAFVWSLQNGCAKRQKVRLTDTADSGSITVDLSDGQQLILHPDTLKEGRRVRAESDR